MPWVKGSLPNLRPERPREPEPRDEPTPVKISRTFQAAVVDRFRPRASACGLSPGLESAGPLGRAARMLPAGLNLRFRLIEAYASHSPSHRSTWQLAETRGAVPMDFQNAFFRHETP
jgi:hypothetical protein